MSVYAKLWRIYDLYPVKAIASRYLTSLTLLCVFFLSTMSLIFPSHVHAATTLPRLSGADRYGTALAVSQKGWGTSENVVLTTGEDFPDALSAAPLAKQLDAPLLLTSSKDLSTTLQTELQRLKAKNVYLVGGEGAISVKVENALKGLGYVVKRIGGHDRYETSLNLATFLMENFDIGNEIAIATGSNFPDALAIAPIAAKQGMPIILSKKTSFPEGLKEYLVEHNIEKAFVIGGTGVISNNVLQQLPNPLRLWGSNRYETNISILNAFYDTVDFRKIFVATGKDFPDALAGAALAAKTGSPLILASEYGVGISTQSLYNEKIDQIWALGGEGALTPYALQRVKSILDYGVTNQIGNASGNLASGGLAAEQGDYIYFYQKTGEGNNGAIYRMRKDGTNKVKLGETGADISPNPYINVVGDWIYYRKSSPVQILKENDYSTKPETITVYSGSIYKMRTDGTQNTKISNDNASNIHVIDGWIYYHTAKYSNLDAITDPGIYKVRTDGTQKVKLFDFGPTGYEGGRIINIADGYIFFEHGNAGWRITLDGKDKSKVIDAAMYLAFGTKDWLYCVDNLFTNYTQIYKIKPNDIPDDFEERIVIYDDGYSGTWLNLSGTYLYFTGSNGIYKIKTDGTGLTKISAGGGLSEVGDASKLGMSMNLSYIDGYVYYNCYNYNRSGVSETFRIKADGSDPANKEVP